MSSTHYENNEKTITTDLTTNYGTEMRTSEIENIRNRREPITRSLHLPYKPLESTLSDEKLFIEIVCAENLSRSNA